MKTVVITGATSGIGYAAAKALAAEGMRVIGTGRTPRTCADAKAALLDELPNADIVFFSGDLSSQSDVNAIADEILNVMGDMPVTALINNAGGVRSKFTQTPDGCEYQFALNHLAGFLLTHRLWNLIVKGGGRLIMTGSRSHMNTAVHWSDIMYKKRYSCLFAYKQSKLCNVLFARELMRRFERSGVNAYVVDPGLVKTDIGNKKTGGVVNAFWSIRKRYGEAPETVADTYLYLVKQNPAPKGLYYKARLNTKYNSRADSIDDAKRLFELSEALCGIKFGNPSYI
ncbi:MAG: SDR family NAD(P)-dependent oxidoreductase [Christensenellales bacterium]